MGQLNAPVGGLGNLRLVASFSDVLSTQVSMFDVPLHYNFYRASASGPKYDLRTILDGSLVKRRPRDAVTFVDNHDTAIGCSLESWVRWFPCTVVTNWTESRVTGRGRLQAHCIRAHSPPWGGSPVSAILWGTHVRAHHPGGW